MIMSLAAVAGCQSSAGETAGEPTSNGSASSSAAAFPVTIKHQFGETVIESAPKRVLTVGFNEQDFALAFGVEPVGVREFLGYDAPNRPWAPESVRGKEIPTVGSQEINFEKVAELEPDLILGINSYIDRAAYGKLSAIAPTVAQSAEVAMGATTWRDQTLTTGKALGRPEKAQQLVDQVEQQFADARSANPDFKGKTAAFALGMSKKGSYNLGADDYRTGWLQDLGFTVAEKGGEVSLEKLDLFDKDVLVAEGVEDGVLEQKLIKELPPVKDGRFVNLGGYDDDFAGALGFNSPLSLPFLLEIAVPRLAAATDGDPSTQPEPYPN